MEQAILPPAYNPHLKKVLKSYQDAALKSLSGPSNYVATWGNPAAYSIAELEEYRKAFLSGNLKSPLGGETKDITKESFLAAPALAIQQVPLFLPMDSSRGEKSETILEGETIACFIVGGEKRLCLPQILNTVLQDFTLTQINNICDDLHIFCSRCSPEQLETLKLTAVLPWTAPSCGLITKTDAERLCNALLHANPEKSKEPPSPNSFKVYHECFGKCKGIFNPDLYSTPYAKCIECCDCHGMFAPQKFVCHSHKALENRTCHWGFDSANWRSYLLLAKDQECKHKLQETLDQLKARFDFMSKFKRKQSPSPTRTDEKRKRYDEDSQSSRSGSSSWPEGSRENSAFRPWSPTVLNAFKEQKIAASALRSLPSYLQKGPPVLLNPERVIPFSDKHRYERNFAPNVSLAPPSQQKDNGDDEDVNVEKQPDEDTVVVKVETQTEIDVSSDTDTSSLHTESVPSTPQTEPRSEPTVKTEPQGDLETLEREQGRMLEMMREALNATIKEGSREKFIQEFIKLQVNQDTRMKQMINSNRMLQQEVDFLKVSKSEQLRNVLEVQHGLRCEMEKHRAKHEDEMRELQDKCDHLKADLHELEKGQKHPDIIKMKAKYNFQLEELQSIVKNCQAENKKLQQELESLRRHMGKNNHVVPEKSQSAAIEHSSKNPSQDLPEENDQKNKQVTSTQGVKQGAKSPSGAP